MIALENCFEKVVAKVVATRISEQCERRGLRYDGACGCRI
jgi:hypothetical protein